MKINGIGTVSHAEVLSIFTREGAEAIKSGLMSWEEAGEMYKLELTKKASNIGTCVDTFSKNYDRIPESLKARLSPVELAELTDAFYKCYGDGKRAKKED